MLDKNDKRIKWFKEARFGLFIHWGLYSAAEGRWKGHETPGIGEWIAAKEKIPANEYEKLADKLTCDKFEPQYIARLAKEAGMKYCVFTSKHHEGFAMFDTEYDDYSIVKRTPYAKDAAKEIAEAMRGEGITPCFYYSHALDFHEKNARGNTWDNDIPEEERDFKGYINGKCKTQIKELLSNYGKIGMLWLDVPRGMTDELANDIYSFIKEQDPDCLVNGRIMFDPKYGDFGCFGDNQIPAAKPQECWETAATMNNTWGYKCDDHNFKSPEELIELLCELLSKGTNLLLNVGPKPDGSLPEESIYILKEIAKWYKVNSEAVQGTDASPYDCELSFGGASVKDNNLYLYLYAPTDSIELYGLCGKVKRVSVLGGEQLDFYQKDCLHIDTSKTEFGKYVCVLKAEFDSAPSCPKGIFEQENGLVFLPAALCKVIKNSDVSTAKSLAGDAATEAENANLAAAEDMTVNVAGITENWTDEKNYIEWEFEARDEGEYDVCLYSIAQKYEKWVGGHKVHVECNGKRTDECALKEDRISRGANRKYFAETGSDIGVVSVKKGKNLIRLVCDSINRADPIGLGISKLVLKKH